MNDTFTGTIDLTPFCADEKFGRYDLTKTWFGDEWEYATDGRICVRIPAVAANDSHRSYPTAPALFNEHFDSTLCNTPVPIHDGSVVEQKQPCQFDYCSNGRYEDVECPECNGKGWTLIELFTTVKIGQAHFGGRFIQKINALPNARCGINRGKIDNIATLAFTFDGGGQGLLCETTLEIPKDQSPENQT